MLAISSLFKLRALQPPHHYSGQIYHHHLLSAQPLIILYYANVTSKRKLQSGISKSLSYDNKNGDIDDIYDDGNDDCDKDVGIYNYFCKVHQHFIQNRHHENKLCVFVAINKFYSLIKMILKSVNVKIRLPTVKVGQNISEKKISKQK